MRILLRVKCVNEYYDDAPDLFRIQIHPALANRIKRLAEVVKREEAESIHEYNCLGDFMQAPDEFWEVFESSIESTDEEKQAMRDLCFAEDTEVERTEVDRLVVEKDYFHFTAVPKHLDDDCALWTMSVPINILDDRVVEPGYIYEDFGL